ncbi:hypothetical protein QBC46DRAFT_278791 [Diplogelasinospora grovesii]|uniref:Uncharacterized protein n=1 Tax=Diplogelasinospora grovesii TaxID=303347 RepID=A0AAN6NIQ7_9PEZI|nr:hypothetical protein QBC46DRAFT_278791 [Diplogelasinospora grovesii]
MAPPPYMYSAVKNDERFPQKPFDPKAVTRASYERKPPKPKQEGPLVSFNRHPDAYEALGQRNMNFKRVGPRAKSWIKGSRWAQWFLRILELVGAVGLLILMILINNVDSLTGWVMRITPGVVMLHCVYAIYHLWRPAGGRTPGSSAAYHTFAAVSDLCVLPLYAYGALSVRNAGNDWGTLLKNELLTQKYFTPAVYYTLIAAGGLHLLSLMISLWLGVMFRRIAMMPPDMNPLEDHLTRRAHKRNKSSVATASTYSESEKRLDTPLEDKRRSGQPYEDLARPPTIPFMHTRQSSESSLRSSNRDSRGDLPSRQYQVAPGSPRNSGTSQDLKRMSAPPPRSSQQQRGSYTEIPLSDSSRPSSYAGRPSSGTVASYKASPVQAAQTAQPRAAKFSEAWYASDSLISRTQQRTRAMNNQMNKNNAASKKRGTYETLNNNSTQRQRCDMPNESGSESDYDDDNVYDVGLGIRPGRNEQVDSSDESKENKNVTTAHPNPLRSNPSNTALTSSSSSYSSPTKPAKKGKPLPKRPYTPSPYNNNALSEVNLNDRRVSGDITDTTAAVGAWKGRNRDSSIQPETGFYSKPYGELKPGTPPLMVGGNSNSSSSNRQVSSGNDYYGDLGAGGQMGRRHVSGKVAEEGRAGPQQSNTRWSRYSALNE